MVGVLGFSEVGEGKRGACVVESSVDGLSGLLFVVGWFLFGLIVFNWFYYLRNWGFLDKGF